MFFLVHFFFCLQSRLLVIIPGLGSPLIERKFESLHTNIKYIPEDADYLIFRYSDIPEELLSTLPANTKVIFDKGGFSNRFLEVANGDYTDGYSHVFIVLDDITIHSWIPDKTSEPTDYEIFSPTLSMSNMTMHQYLVHNDQELTTDVYTGDFLELFAYYMTVTAFKKYSEFLTNENPWGWGVDLIIREHVDLHPVIFNGWTMDHWKPGTTTPANGDPCNDYLRKFDTSFAECSKRFNERVEYDMANFEIRALPPSHPVEFKKEIETIRDKLEDHVVEFILSSKKEDSNLANSGFRKKGTWILFGCGVIILVLSSWMFLKNK
jgi:hypothetical protein